MSQPWDEDNTPTGFPTLGDPPFAAASAETAMGELRVAAQGVAAALTFNNTEKRCTVWKKGSEGARAGITMPYEGSENDIEPATLISVKGEMLGWTFKRLWYYWACSTNTNPVPQAAAAKLNETMRHQARVNGHCNGQSPSKEGVRSYHVDTVEGLTALLRAISGDRREAMRATSAAPPAE